LKPSVFITLLVLLLGGLGFLGYKTFFPEVVYVTCQACQGTGKKPCKTPDCPDGTMPCPNNCLKKDDGQWESMHVDGHPDTDLWHKFEYSNGGWAAYNQNHAGHVIELVNGVWTDKGVCPVCHGKGKVPCPQCENAPPCDVCHGKGVVPKEI